jgi:hypothetical protein
VCAAEYGRPPPTSRGSTRSWPPARCTRAADPTALALYAGLSAEPSRRRPARHAAARAAPGVPRRRIWWRCAPSGCTTRRSSSTGRGTPPCSAGLPDEVVEITDDDRARREAAEALTDDIVRPAYAVLDPAGRAALLAGLDAIETAITGG